MTEERHREPDEAAAWSSDNGAQGTPVADPPDEIAIEEGEPESLSPSTQPDMKPTPLPAQPEPRKRAEARRARGRVTVRIPDDEVARPTSSASAPPPPDSAPVIEPEPESEPPPPPPLELSHGAPILATRIITINPPPPVEEPEPKSVEEPGVDALGDTTRGAPSVLAQAHEEDSWTPFQPTVEDVSVHDRDKSAPPPRVEAGASPVAAEASEPEVAEEARDKRPLSSPDIVIDEDIPPEMAEPIAPPPESTEALEVEETESEPKPAVAPPKAPSTDEALEAEEISLESEPPPRSEPADLAEVSPEDVVSVESVPGKPQGRKAGHISKPPVAPPPAPPAVRPPLLLVPGSASPLAPPPMSEAAATRRRARPWWEDLFNDDFIRTMAKVTDAQIATEVNFIEESLGLAKGAVVLDLACGTGRHAIEMTSRGYQVVGFDLSLAMLARAADEAQERDQKLNFVQGDMREMTFEETFDGVYAWNTSFGFFEEEKNSAVISNLHRALKAGGLLLLDVANRDYLARQSPSLAWFEGDGCVCMDEMHVDWITSRMRVKRTMMLDDGRTRETDYSIRVYALHELGKILHDHGFRVAEVSGRVATPGVFFGADSPRILVVAEKR
jgi:SAM-dependent methyltransferase